MGSFDNETRTYLPGSFEVERHFYPKVINAHLHPLVRYLLALGNRRIAERYCHLHPDVDAEAVMGLLSRRSRSFHWGGGDLLHVTDEDGRRWIVVIETNSCPSGQKSMPPIMEELEQAGYRRLLETSFLPLLRRCSVPGGGLAVLYDKNPMENTGYAAVLSELTGEPVHLVPFHTGVEDPPARFTSDGLLEVRNGDGAWQPVRAAFRYVTQRPWNRIPPVTRSLIYNPVLACLAGGRNKMLAAKAYDLFNAEIAGSGLAINTPETIWDVSREEVPLWVRRMGDVAVVKNPYSNAGQGVYTIASEQELEAFMESEQRYDRFIVQALVGNIGWSSRGSGGRLYHVGTMPDKHCRIFAIDIRFMVGVGPDGSFPVAIYARRARSPLARQLGDCSSWEMLGTNLSVRRADGGWDTESERLLLMDSREFNRLGLSLDDLIECYIQTVLAMGAIDSMAGKLLTRKGKFRKRFFRTINQDRSLCEEIRP